MMLKGWINQKQTHTAVPSIHTPYLTAGSQATQKNNWIREAYKKCPYKVGDVVKYSKIASASKKANNNVTVLGLCTSIFDFPKDEDITNNPRIVLARDDATGEIFTCTINYLEPI